MANLFSVAEIVDIGIEKEKKRRDFYGAVAERAIDPELTALFRRLRDWEEEHVRAFGEIRAGVDERESVDSYPGEGREYMESLVADQLYQAFSPAAAAGKITSPREAIEMGIGFEKDAILFFRALSDFLSPSQRTIVERLIREEQGHLVSLSRLRESFPPRKGEQTIE
ncbi:MAG: ferritin family protein [Candidatus Aureabacteria bacterium]|nr:ferritin family protein [Candidatus Auribacterota bacterium]